MDLVENKDGRTWFDAAASDFEKAIEKKPKYEQAIDLLGLSYEQAGEEDKAIRAYTQEMALVPFGKQRLADAYCSFGFRHQQEKDLAAAAAEYEKSTEFGVADDKSCPYDPFENGVAIYTTETHEYDKAWAIVYRGLKMGKPISPGLIQQLMKDSGRTH
jgi:tetratricopeptide (TPR) repeat protein